MQGKIITISRQCGSGGHSIGSELAKRLDVPFYDREIIEMAAKERFCSDVSPQLYHINRTGYSVPSVLGCWYRACNFP